MTTPTITRLPGCKCRQVIGDEKTGFALMVEDYCPVHGNQSAPDRLNLEAAAAFAATLRQRPPKPKDDEVPW